MTVTSARGRGVADVCSGVVLVCVWRLCVSVSASLRARLAQSVERKALNLVVVGSSPTLGVQQRADVSQELEDARVLRTSRGPNASPGRSARRDGDSGRGISMGNGAVEGSSGKGEWWRTGLEEDTRLKWANVRRVRACQYIGLGLLRWIHCYVPHMNAAPFEVLPV